MLSIGLYVQNDGVGGVIWRIAERWLEDAFQAGGYMYTLSLQLTRFMGMQHSKRLF